MSILEKDIQREICEWLETQRDDLYFWRQNNTPVHGRAGFGDKVRFRNLPKYAVKGVPDIFVIKRSKFIGLEVKTPRRKLTPEQAQFGVNMVQNGAFYQCVHSLQEAKDFLDNF